MAIGPVQFIGALLERGLAPTAALREFRAAGGRVRTQTWYRAWGEVAGELATRERVQAAPLRRRPIAEEITRRTSKKPGAFLYRGQIAVNRRLRDERGRLVDYELQWLPASVRTRRLLTYTSVMDQMTADAAEGGDSYDYAVLGAMVSTVSELVPETAL